MKRENEAIRLLKESKEHEQSATEKEANANTMLETSEQNKHKAESAKLDAENARKETEKLLLQNQNLVESFNSEYIEKSQKIESWNEAAEEIDNSDFWMKSAFTEYKANPSKENALQTLFKKVKNGVAAAIVKVKQTYDAKIKEMNERLFGHKRIYHTENKIVCEYSYGESDYADMLRDTPVSDIEAAISETRKKGKLTFAEAAATCEGLSFYERFFTKAKTLTHEREIELSKERKRLGITR